jgi:hypothetical protein
MDEENILVEVSAEDKEHIISGFVEIGAIVIDEIEVKRLDGVDTFQFIIDISKVALPGATGLLIGILKERQVKIKKGNIEYQGPFDRTTINRIINIQEEKEQP